MRGRASPSSRSKVPSLDCQRRDNATYSASPCRRLRSRRRETVTGEHEGAGPTSHAACTFHAGRRSGVLSRRYRAYRRHDARYVAPSGTLLPSPTTQKQLHIGSGTFADDAAPRRLRRLFSRAGQARTIHMMSSSRNCAAPYAARLYSSSSIDDEQVAIGRAHGDASYFRRCERALYHGRCRAIYFIALLAPA